MKRIFDFTASLLLLIILSPVFLIVSLLILIDSGFPVIFRQYRVGKDNKLFYIYKFRTMKNNTRLAATKDLTEADSVITKSGRILRKTSLDELPQLFNVLKGDMSFVGQRPEMVENVELYSDELPEFKYRLRVKAGLTGYAQIAGKYNTTPKDKLMMDMMYIENYTIFKDIQLLFQTAIVLLKSDSTEAFHTGKKKKEYIFVEAREEEME